MSRNASTTINAFALYRLPHQQQVALIGDNQHATRQLTSIRELDCGEAAFVIAPFNVTDHECIVILQPDVYLQWNQIDDIQLPELPWHFKPSQPNRYVSREQYSQTFRTFHQQLEQGNYVKLVLARSIEMPCESARQAISLFKQACIRYPDAFVSLFSAPPCGTWLAATPEVLIEGDNTSGWHTIALAGTKQIADTTPWDEKNKHEQRIVAEYIAQCAQAYSTGMVTQQGPRTVQAGHLQHLRTDFYFNLDSPQQLPHLIDSLHPTPAVCGLPKEAACGFITAHEGLGRGYYSGYCGIHNAGGATHLYVTLRCMQLQADRCVLYAGGGIVPDSREETEWQETAAKLQTMATLLKQ